ncbi:hypothetical protein TRFO_20837 [Tritrichomonas foetus]|uniref:Uncharacterized protein n=1 Tax=Tritrichomonas foetus TaxID=1144522 RepID=A0A1J4KG83_9EUKA|nr:hypothetical protein TRFO_20837 [Tritrichomonas foetus]|eukprot:OHT10034.1 hypothetical protein TRFO_20837 [Tritrichomonas foetus]
MLLWMVFTLISWESALSLACFSGDEELVKYLLNYVTQIDRSPDIKCKSAIHWICQSHSLNIVREVLKHNIDVNRFDDKGQPGPFYLLDRTSEEVTIDILELLVQYGYDINNVYRYHQQQKSLLCHFLSGIKPVYRIIEWLLQHGADPSIPFYTNNHKKLNAYDIAKKKPLMKSLLDKYVK